MKSCGEQVLPFAYELAGPEQTHDVLFIPIAWNFGVPIELKNNPTAANANTTPKYIRYGRRGNTTASVTQTTALKRYKNEIMKS